MTSILTSLFISPILLIISSLLLIVSGVILLWLYSEDELQ